MEGLDIFQPHAYFVRSVDEVYDDTASEMDDSSSAATSRTAGTYDHSNACS